MNKPRFIYFLIFLLFCSFITGEFFIYSNFNLDYNPGYSRIIRNTDKFLKLFDDVKLAMIEEKKDFLEANLEEMAIRVFKGGVLEKEVPILAKGDPESWGGSAAGLYKIMSGNKVSFSNIAKVYMPYALRYFGKYYIHGEPYYPGGEKLASDVSGGCLRLEDEDAKEIYNLVDIDIPFLVIDKERADFHYSKSFNLKIPEVLAESYLIADMDSGFVFSDKESNKAVSIGFLTELMTASVVAESVNLERSIKTDLGELRVVEIFYSLLMGSFDQAANDLARFLGKDKTVRLMNEKAKSILMENTAFVSPSGIELENVSTAQDLFYLARYISNNRYLLWQISKGKRVTSFGELSVNIKEIENKNLFVNEGNLFGAKSTEDSGIFVFNFKKEGQERGVAVIILKSTGLKNDIQSLYAWLVKSYFN
jgi:hypothetical protein